MSCEDLSSAGDPCKYEIAWNSAEINGDPEFSETEPNEIGMETYFVKITNILKATSIDVDALRETANQFKKSIKSPRMAQFIYYTIANIFFTRMASTDNIDEELPIEEKVKQLQPIINHTVEETSLLWAFIRDCESGKVPATKIKVAPRRVDKLRVICWDLGNLFPKCLKERMMALADLLEREKFDIILLQEVSLFVINYLKFRLGSDYTFNAGRDFEEHELVPYNVSYTLTRNETAKFVESKIIYFARTGENRTLIKTQIKIGSELLYILNTHLESGHLNSECRTDQLKKCFKIFQSIPKTASVIFGGQLNVRDWEIFRKLGVNQNSLKKWDLWMQFGNKENEFSWDLRINKLIQMPDDRPQPFKRFGRMYFRNNSDFGIKPVLFDLLGKELVTEAYCISDHFALLGEFAVNPSCYREVEIAKTLKEQIAKQIPLDEKIKVIQEKVKDNWDDSDED